MLLLSTLLFLAALPILTWLHTQYRFEHRLTPQPLPPHPPLISVIVPARNEERNIRACVESLIAQDYPNLEVIVVDDRSTDATPRLLAQLQAEAKLPAEASRPQGAAAAEPTQSALSAILPRPRHPLEIVHGQELPPGWAGKPHALYQGAQRARGEWLCFVDADTRLQPETIGAAYALAVQEQADLLTLLTRQRLESFWEWVIQPIVLTALSVGFSPRRVNDPRRPDAIANGQFILIRRQVYETIGGHAAIRSSIVEDKDLAERVKGQGYRLLLADGEEFAETRMYTSFGEIWEGWTKNIYLGLREKRSLQLLGVFGAFLALCAALLLPIWLCGGLVWWQLHPARETVLIPIQAALIWGYLLFWRWRVARALNIPSWSILFTPLAAGIFAAMMFASAWKVLSGRGVTWKGRRYLPTQHF